LLGFPIRGADCAAIGENWRVKTSLIGTIRRKAVVHASPVFEPLILLMYRAAPRPSGVSTAALARAVVEF
jgi:hypothetical protein